MPQKELTERSIKSIHDALVEFGYSSLTIEYVREMITDLLAGEKAKSAPGMFIERWLKEANLID